jgi:Flp pilus assembly protein TadD
MAAESARTDARFASFTVADHFKRAVDLSPKDATARHLLGLWCAHSLALASAGIDPGLRLGDGARTPYLT